MVQTPILSFYSMVDKRMLSLLLLTIEIDSKDGGYTQEAMGVGLVCKSSCISMYFLWEKTTAS